MNIEWKAYIGVPISDKTKLEWIKECLETLKKNPKQWETGMSSGNSYIHVQKYEEFYEITEYEPRRTAFIDRDPNDVDPCICEIDVLNKSGCKCGGV